MGFFVYIHTSPSKKRYVGVTTKSTKARWDNGNGYRHNKHFFRAIQKYGWENFTHQVFEVQSEESMYMNERELIELFKTTDPQYGYNHSIGGDKGPVGCKRSDETKRKISVAQTGKYGGSKNPFFGKHHTDETKEKIRIANSGRKRTPEHLQAIKKSTIKPVIDQNGILYESVAECREALRISGWLFYKKIKTGEFRYAS